MGYSIAANFHCYFESEISRVTASSSSFAAIVSLNSCFVRLPNSNSSLTFMKDDLMKKGVRLN